MKIFVRDNRAKCPSCSGLLTAKQDSYTCIDCGQAYIGTGEGRIEGEVIVKETTGGLLKICYLSDDLHRLANIRRMFEEKEAKRILCSNATAFRTETTEYRFVNCGDPNNYMGIYADQAIIDYRDPMIGIAKIITARSTIQEKYKIIDDRIICTESYERDVDEMIERLLDMDIVGEDNSIIFTDEAKQLIHEISEECMKASMIVENKDRADEYGKGLSAEDVYMDMLLKIVNAPTSLHMLMSARMLIPVIDKKLRAGDEN